MKIKNQKSKIAPRDQKVRTPQTILLPTRIISWEPCTVRGQQARGPEVHQLRSEVDPEAGRARDGGYVRDLRSPEGRRLSRGAQLQRGGGERKIQHKATPPEQWCGKSKPLAEILYPRSTQNAIWALLGQRMTEFGNFRKMLEEKG